MFGAYPQIASYMQSVNDMYLDNVERLPAYLRPKFRSRQSWNQGREKDGLTEDFIMVAEFSELEGPKPVMTIPKDGGANFDQNAFSVRIMAVDCQNSTVEFSVTEDAQIVLSDKKTGVFAFVHHFVLYDNTARGYVRPYCIAYITTDPRKLMHFYEDLSLQFKKVARFLKYGNRLLFVGDLERHLKDLEYTKNVLLSQVSKIRLKNNVMNGKSKHLRRNAEQDLLKALHTIQESNVEIKKILSTLKPILTNRRLEARFRLLEERAFQRTSHSEQNRQPLQDSWYNDLSTLDKVNLKNSSLIEPRMSSLALFKPREYKPVLVKTKKARRFNAPLRGLFELCSWGAKEGVRKLGYIHEYFKRDTIVLELEKNESRLFYPNSSSISYGRCVIGNFLCDVHMKKFDVTGEIEQGWSILNSYHWNSIGSLDSLNSFKSAVSCPSSLNGLQEASPSSYYTYASLSSHIFHSAASSPEEEFSFLANNEYYLDLDNDADEEGSFDKWSSSMSLSQNEENDEDGLIDKPIMYESKDCVQEHGNVLLENGDEAAANNKFIKTLSQAVNQIVENEDNQTLNSNLPSVSLNNPELTLCRKSVRESFPASNKETAQGIIRSEIGRDMFIKNKSSKGKQEPVNRTLVKTRGLDLVSTNSDLDIDTTENYSAIIHCQNLQDKYDCSALKLNACIENCNHNSSIVDASNAGDHLGDSWEKNVALDISDNITENKASHPKNIYENSISVDSCTKTNNQTGGHSVILPKKIKSVAGHDSKIVNVAAEDDQQVLFEHSVNFHAADATSKTENGDSSDILELVKSHLSQNCIGWSSPVSSSETTLSSSVPSSWLSENGAVYAHKLASHSTCDNVTQKTIKECRKSYTKQLPSLLLQKHHYTHQIIGKTHLQNGAITQDGINHEISSLKVRSESDASSAFTTSSIQDLYPHLEDVRNEFQSLSDNFQTHSLSGRCEATEKDFVNMSISHNTGVGKAGCRVHTIGDWINNLTFGRPGFCLSEVLSTYHNLEHVIYSLLSGRPVLVVGPARLEQDVIKLVNALAVFVPETGRNYLAVLDWTAQCLKITDLTKLKLVGLCRPERRSAESFIPSAVKRACTVVDIERRVITAPPYQGQLIMALLSKRKVFRLDIQMLSYIEWWLMDILAKAFLFFHSFCLGSAGSILYSHSPKDQRDAYCSTVCSVMFRLGVKDHDCEIVEYLAELAKVSELEHHTLHSVDSGNVIQPLTLQHKTCEKFRC